MLKQNNTKKQKKKNEIKIPTQTTLSKKWISIHNLLSHHDIVYCSFVLFLIKNRFLKHQTNASLFPLRTGYLMLFNLNQIRTPAAFISTSN